MNILKTLENIVKVRDDLQKTRDDLDHQQRQLDFLVSEVIEFLQEKKIIEARTV